MHIVDSHCHVSDRWYEPVETLLFQMDRLGIGQAVLVQLLGQYDNAYQQACVQRYPGRFASVVSVDIDRADACDQLRALALAGAAGVRLRPGARSPGNDPLALWRCALESKLAVSCVGNAASFCDPAFAALMADLSPLTIALEHLGGTSTPPTDDAGLAARLGVFELSRFPNVYLKLPGLGELMPRSPTWATGESSFGTSMPSLLAEALECFGPARIMWGSDFPPVASREGYALALRACQQAMSGLDHVHREQLFGGTARRIFF